MYLKRIFEGVYVSANKIEVKIGKSLTALAEELNLSPETILQELADWLDYILLPYKEQLKSGKSLPVILSDLASHADLGFKIDRWRIGEVLKHKDLHLDDFDVDLNENYFWFHYTSGRGGVDEVNLWLENGVATISYIRYISKGKVEKIRRLLEQSKEDFYGDDMDYDCDYELEVIDNQGIELTLQYDDMGLDFPDVKRISHIFNRLERQASKMP